MFCLSPYRIWQNLFSFRGFFEGKTNMYSQANRPDQKNFNLFWWILCFHMIHGKSSIKLTFRLCFVVQFDFRYVLCLTNAVPKECSSIHVFPVNLQNKCSFNQNQKNKYICIYRSGSAHKKTILGRKRFQLLTNLHAKRFRLLRVLPVWGSSLIADLLSPDLLEYLNNWVASRSIWL